ncbi:MAG: hypothetical protein H5T74_12025 [Actinobacteria bacterium]|nr:hypothetical protein [Actinomycetota bacterium]
MAVEGEAGRSFFTRQLERLLAGEGVAVPSYLLDLLDKPFREFTPGDRGLYEGQIKAKGLLRLFARLLQRAYEASPESSRHSWRGMYHLLPDSPIKACAAFVLEGEMAGATAGAGAPGNPRVEPAGTATVIPGHRPGPKTDGAPSRGAPPDPAGGEEPPAAQGARRSFFTRKLERKLEERGIKVPEAIIALLDRPFEEFTPEDRALYEAEFKGRQLTILFSDLLDELYEETGKCESGWSAMCRFLKDTPMKLIATYVLQEEERLEEVGEPSPSDLLTGTQPREKYKVRSYQPAPHRDGSAAEKRRRLLR